MPTKLPRFLRQASRLLGFPRFLRTWLAPKFTVAFRRILLDSVLLLDSALRDLDSDPLDLSLVMVQCLLIVIIHLVLHTVQLCMVPTQFLVDILTVPLVCHTVPPLGPHTVPLTVPLVFLSLDTPLGMDYLSLMDLTPRLPLWVVDDPPLWLWVHHLQLGLCHPCLLRRPSWFRPYNPIYHLDGTVSIRARLLRLLFALIRVWAPKSLLFRLLSNALPHNG